MSALVLGFCAVRVSVLARVDAQCASLRFVAQWARFLLAFESTLSDLSSSGATGVACASRTLIGVACGSSLLRLFWNHSSLPLFGFCVIGVCRRFPFSWLFRGAALVRVACCLLFRGVFLASGCHSERVACRGFPDGIPTFAPLRSQHFRKKCVQNFARMQ